jgi:hypothetical protein
MKAFAFILSIYIFALNLAPCVDYDAHDINVKTKFSQDIGGQHQWLDLCSPFCICQCCHISATYFQFEDTQLAMSYISTEDFFYLIVSEKSFSTSILQPPRI